MFSAGHGRLMIINKSSRINSFCGGTALKKQPEMAAIRLSEESLNWRNEYFGPETSLKVQRPQYYCGNSFPVNETSCKVTWNVAVIGSTIWMLTLKLTAITARTL